MKNKISIVGIILIIILIAMGCKREKAEEKIIVEKHGMMEDGNFNLKPLIEYYEDNPESIPEYSELKYVVYNIYMAPEEIYYVLDMEDSVFYNGCALMELYSINTTAEEAIPLEKIKKEQIYELMTSYHVATWDSRYNAFETPAVDYSWVLALEFEDGTIARYAGDNDWDDKSPEGYSEFEQAWADLAEEWIKEYHLENPDQSTISSLEGLESGMKQVSENDVSNEVPTEEE